MIPAKKHGPTCQAKWPAGPATLRREQYGVVLYHGHMNRADRTASPPPRLESPPGGSAWRIAAVPAGIVIAALVIRLLYLHQIVGIPFFHELISDAKGYDDWARSIAAGNWWGDTAFYQAPLYPYFLAVVKVLGGESPYAARLVQAVLGAASCGLIALAGGWFFSRRAGLWAGGILALYPPAIFFDGLIQKTSLGQFLAATLLMLMAWTYRREHWAKLLAVGLVSGLFCLTRENALALVPVLVVWAWAVRPLTDGKPVRVAPVMRARRTALLLAGAALVLTPVALRNMDLGGGFSLTTVQMGPNFYIGNNAEATGRYRPLVKGHETPEFERNDATRLAEEAVGRRLSPGEMSDYWMTRAWQYISSRPIDWLRLMGTKTLLVLNAYEIPDSESYYVYAEWSWLLGTLSRLLHFGVLLPLAAGGVVLTWPRRRELWVLYAMWLVTSLAVAAFFVFARYRYPLVPITVIFAGVTIADTITHLRSNTFSRPPARRLFLAALAVVAPVALLANITVNPESELNAMAWTNLGVAFARQEQIPAATACFERAVEGAPGSPEARNNLGLAYVRQQRLADAALQFREALRLAPGLMEVDYQLALVLERLGRTAEAVTHYRRALELNPKDADARRALERLGQQ